jgi:hypothetical protein
MYNNLSPCAVRLSIQSHRNSSMYNKLQYSMKSSKDMIFKVQEAVTMMSTVFWDVTSCSLVEVYRRFGLAYFLSLQFRRVNRARKEAV